MRLLKIIIIALSSICFGLNAIGQANATLNILTLNAGQVNAGSVVDLQVSVGNTGPGSIAVNKVRAQISIPIAIATALPNIQQTGLPAGWIILSNTGAGITVCNGTDVIPAGEQRQIFIKIQGTAVGGPSTINGSLSFGPGSGVCSGPGSLPGDNTADNTSTTSITVVAVAACNISATANAGTITCNGGTTTVTSTATGAAGPIEYSLDGTNFQSTNSFTVGAGTYTVTVRETGRPSCSTITNTVNITEPLIVQPPLITSITQPTCITVTGSVQIGGLPPGNWTITNIPGGATTAGTGITTIITGLTGGTYAFTVTNVAGCTSAESANTVINPISVPTAPTVDLVQPTCSIATGTVTIISSTTGSTFSLDGNTYAAYPVGGYTVIAGPHTLTEQNSSGCISPVTNFSTTMQPATPGTPVIDLIIQPSCAISTGSVILSGLPSGNWTIDPGNISGNTTTTAINNLSPGTYNFTVTNDAGCTSNATADVIINTVPGAPAAPAINILQPTCTVATATITITSAAAGLVFSFDGNVYTAYPAGGYITTAGAHTLTAQNAASCISTSTNITVNPQPATPANPVVSIVQPTCNVAIATVSITSITTGLTFSLDGVSYASYPTGGYSIPSGLHTLTAQNSDGCSSGITNFTIDAQPASPTGTLSAGTILCNSGATTLTVTASGGTGSYEYSLDNNPFQLSNNFIVVAGTYSVKVRDANLCVGTVPDITIIQPSPITATAVAGTAQSCSSGTTTLTVNASGGTGNLEYSLNGGSFQSGNIFTVDATGSPYSVTVKDANNCSSTTNEVSVTLPAALVVLTNAPRIAQCGGTTTVTVTGQGGIVPYTGEGVFNKGPGNWSFSITDAAGCTASATINIEAPGCLYLNVYPNPTKNIININHSIAGPGATMQIFSVTGQRLLTRTVAENSFFTSLDVSKLPGATYILVFINDGEKKQMKFEKVTK